MIISNYPKKCLENCDNYIGGFACLAFPDVIPDAIITGEVIHDKEVSGDNGIIYSQPKKRG